MFYASLWFILVALNRSPYLINHSCLLDLHSALFMCYILSFVPAYLLFVAYLEDGPIPQILLLITLDLFRGVL